LKLNVKTGRSLPVQLLNQKWEILTAILSTKIDSLAQKSAQSGCSSTQNQNQNKTRKKYLFNYGAFFKQQGVLQFSQSFAHKRLRNPVPSMRNIFLCWSQSNEV
jgi:hypothetical protein